MNKIKPLDQVLSIGADAPNHTTKVVNKFGSQDCILYKLKEFSSSVQDFRRLCKGNIRHRLDDIIMLLILARASKCVTRIEIIEFGRHNLNKFRKLGLLKKGVPSEATLCRVEHGINKEALAKAMQEFAIFSTKDYSRQTEIRRLSVWMARQSAALYKTMDATLILCQHIPTTLALHWLPKPAVRKAMR